MISCSPSLLQIAYKQEGKKTMDWKLKINYWYYTIAVSVKCDPSHRNLPVVDSYMFLFSQYSLFWCKLLYLEKHTNFSMFSPHKNNTMIWSSWLVALSVFLQMQTLRILDFTSETKLWKEKHVADDNWLVLMWWVTYAIAIGL